MTEWAPTHPLLECSRVRSLSAYCVLLLSRARISQHARRACCCAKSLQPRALKAGLLRALQQNTRHVDEGRHSKQGADVFLKTGGADVEVLRNNTWSQTRYTVGQQRSDIICHGRLGAIQQLRAGLVLDTGPALHNFAKGPLHRNPGGGHCLIEGLVLCVNEGICIRAQDARHLRVTSIGVDAVHSA